MGARLCIHNISATGAVHRELNIWKKYKKIEEVLGLYYFNPKGISTDQENNSWKQDEEKEIFHKYQEMNKPAEPPGIIL